MINLGDVVRDKITGFKGVAIARTEWLNGCARILVQPQELHEGSPIESVSFDEPQCEIMSTETYAPQELSRTGGPRKDPEYRPHI